MVSNVEAVTAIEKLKEVKQGAYTDKRNYYMFDNYNIKYMFIPIMVSSNILIRIRDAFVDGLNSDNKLPRVVLVIISRDFKKFTELPGLCEGGAALLLTQLFGAVEKRKQQLNKNCYRASEPKFIILKPVPLYENMDVLGKE